MYVFSSITTLGILALLVGIGSQLKVCVELPTSPNLLVRAKIIQVCNIAEFVDKP